MTTLYLVVPGRPIAKPRMTGSDAWNLRPIVDAYRQHVDRVRAAAIDAKRAAGMGDFDAWPGPTEVRITFEANLTHVTVSSPTDAGARPRGLRGDVDNLTKTVLEGLQPQRGVMGSSILRDDRQVVALQASIRAW